jgi:hypothetical protein
MSKRILIGLSAEAGYDRGGLVPALRVVWAGPVVPVNPKDPSVEFSAWTYAKKRCKDFVSARHRTS